MKLIDWTNLFGEYRGQWVALKEDEQTVAGSGKTLRDALDDANRNGYAQPGMLKVPEELITLVSPSPIDDVKTRRPAH